jgi:hypothetical protein
MDMRHLAERNVSDPISRAACPFVWQITGPILSDRDSAGGVVTDISADIGIDEVLGRARIKV